MHTAFQILSYSYHRAVGLAPWLLLAIVLAQLIQHVRINALVTGGARRRTALAAVTTTAFGAFTPFCACSIVPLIRGFLRAGMPLSVVMSFWIASPAMEPEIFGLTAKAFGWQVAVARLAGAIALGLGSAVIAHVLVSRGWMRRILRDVQPRVTQADGKPVGASAADPKTAATARTELTVLANGVSGHGASRAAVLVADAPRRAVAETPVATAGSCCGAVGAHANSATADSVSVAEADNGGSCSTPTTGQVPSKRWWEQARQGLKEVSVWDFAAAMLRDCWLLGRWMLLAIAIEALIRQFVPASAFAGILGSSLVASVCIAAVLSIPLYLNGVSAIPIGAGLMAMGMGPAAMTTFLLAGSITTIPAMAGVRVTVTTRVFALYLGTGVIGSILVGLAAAPFMR